MATLRPIAPPCDRASEGCPARATLALYSDDGHEMGRYCGIHARILWGHQEQREREMRARAYAKKAQGKVEEAH